MDRRAATPAPPADTPMHPAGVLEQVRAVGPLCSSTYHPPRQRSVFTSQYLSRLPPRTRASVAPFWPIQQLQSEQAPSVDAGSKQRRESTKPPIAFIFENRRRVWLEVFGRGMVQPGDATVYFACCARFVAGARGSHPFCFVVEDRIINYSF